MDMVTVLIQVMNLLHYSNVAQKRNSAVVLNMSMAVIFAIFNNWPVSLYISSASKMASRKIQCIKLCVTKCNAK